MARPTSGPGPRPPPPWPAGSEGSMRPKSRRGIGVPAMDGRRGPGPGAARKAAGGHGDHSKGQEDRRPPLNRNWERHGWREATLSHATLGLGFRLCR